MKAPFTTICPYKRSVWYGKRTQCVYSSNGERVCVVQRWDGKSTLDEDAAKFKAEMIAEALNRAFREGGDK